MAPILVHQSHTQRMEPSMSTHLRWLAGEAAHRTPEDAGVLCKEEPRCPQHQSRRHSHEHLTHPQVPSAQTSATPLPLPQGPAGSRCPQGRSGPFVGWVPGQEVGIILLTCAPSDTQHAVPLHQLPSAEPQTQLQHAARHRTCHH